MLTAKAIRYKPTNEYVHVTVDDFATAALPHLFPMTMDLDNLRKYLNNEELPWDDFELVILELVDITHTKPGL